MQRGNIKFDIKRRATNLSYKSLKLRSNKKKVQKAKCLSATTGEGLKKRGYNTVDNHKLYEK